LSRLFCKKRVTLNIGGIELGDAWWETNKKKVQVKKKADTHKKEEGAKGQVSLLSLSLSRTQSGAVGWDLKKKTKGAKGGDLG